MLTAILRPFLPRGQIPLALQSPDQILDYFVGQFGERVLAEPRAGGAALLLYAGPPLALIIGVGIAAVYIRRWNSLQRVSGERVGNRLRKDRSKTPTRLHNAALTQFGQCFVQLSGADAIDTTQSGEFAFVRDIFSVHRVEKRQILCGPKQLLVGLITLAEYPLEKLTALSLPSVSPLLSV